MASLYQEAIILSDRFYLIDLNQFKFEGVKYLLVQASAEYPIDYPAAK